MASDVSICNLALAHLGDAAEVSAISPVDGSAQAALCARFYPICLNALLVMHAWSFAVRRVTASLLDTDELPPEWAYAYAYPNCLKLISVVPPAVSVATSQGYIFEGPEFEERARLYPFTVETLADGSQAVYTNVEEAVAFYIAPITDTSKFQPLFVVALARLLSAHLAGPVLRGKEGQNAAKSMLEWFYKVDYPNAVAANASAARNNSYDVFRPGGIVART